MDIISAILGVIFIGILIALAMIFGVAMIVFIMAVAVVTGFLVLVRSVFRRWRFEHQVRTSETRSQQVIEGDYQDITGKDNQR